VSYLAYRDRFAAAMDPRLYPIEYLDWLLASGAARIWFGEQSALVAQVKTFPGGALALNILVAAGDRDELVNTLYPRVEEWGRAMGCIVGLIESRPGWARVMRGHGYDTFQVSIIKDL
jgi:hypothetical protein